MAEVHTTSFRFNVQFENILDRADNKVQSSTFNMQLQSSKFKVRHPRHNHTKLYLYFDYKTQNSLVG